MSRAAQRWHPPAAAARAIEVVGARTHNLKDVTCAIPIGALTVVTGPSGSGKSSLAFDTVYAEGQRRFVESMSTYARQFLERMERPDVDRIEHVLPALAIEQKAPARSARSTVGTATEIQDTLRLLFAAIGTRVCPDCARPVVRGTPAGVLASLLGDWGEDARVLVAAPVPVKDLARQTAEWCRAGYTRALDASGAARDISPEAPPEPRSGVVRLLVGRHRLREGDAELMTTLGTAFALGDGALVARRHDTGEERRFFAGLVCGCGRAFEEITPAHLSFNSPRGACPACQGFGRLVGIDPLKVVPDPGKTLDERAIAPFNSPAYESAYPDLFRACRRHRVRRDVPWRDLTDEERAVVWDGRGSWYGVRGLFEWLEKKRYKVHVRVFLARYRGYPPCGACGGTRLNETARTVLVRGRDIAAVSDLMLGDLVVWLDALRGGLTDGERARAAHLVDDLRRRASTLVEIGLSYLTLTRQVRTLSGGEAQRVQLGSAIGNALTGTLYVLDEPTVGLHPRDTARLLGVLHRLKSAGNAVLVVEHDVDVMRAADHILDLGPGAGRLGGRLLFEGTPAQLATRDTATARALAGGEIVLRAAESVAAWSPRELRVVGARAHNLKDITVRIPLGKLVAVSGVSGSGKSSLVVDVLAAGALRALGKGARLGADELGEHDRIEGLAALTDVVLVDQSPLGRSSRSNPATYTKAWDEIRALYAKAESARALGLTKASFSFNAKGGRCERCEGSGVVSIDMQFLADVTVVCDVCDGRRFSRDVLSVRVRGRNVAELLETTVEEAIETFAEVRAIVQRLGPLCEAGLSYLTLGQSTATLSGGEAQRLKVASFLTELPKGHVLFVFDEPTTGLHPSDVAVLLRVFRKLIGAGHSIVAVEHNLDFLRAADHLLELGPGAGPDGGRLVFEGTPSRLASEGVTPTGAALAAQVAAARMV